jgi:glycosyltransferase involved in cell wall biosynthesis
MTRLLVLSPGELSRDPRARRAALTARANGLEVQGLCLATEQPLPLPDIPVKRIRAARFERTLRAGGLGGMSPSRPVLRELRGLYRLLRHLRVTSRLIRSTRRLGEFDVVHANDLDTLPAAWRIARAHDARLVYDAHELYTRQEPDPPRLYRAAAERLESALARRADTVVTVNAEIASELERDLGLRSAPLVVLSCPPRDDTSPPDRSEARLQAVYQGAMGPGRMLDDLLAAAEDAPGVDLTIRVTGADLEALRASVERRELADRVRVAEPVPPDGLVEALRGYDVGLIINRLVTRNDELVLPNKLFEYLMAGLTVVAPALPSLAALLEREQVGLTFAPGDPSGMAAALTRLAADPELLARLRRRAREAALERFNAEAQAPVLLQAWGVR